MTLPTDLVSFAGGFDLTAARYSGGAGGTFTNLLAGEENWTVNGATPSFSTKGARSGMDFTNSATETIRGQMRCQREATVIMVLTTASADDASNYHAFGGNDATALRFGVNINARRAACFTPLLSSGFTAAYTSNAPVVVSVSWSPENQRCYVQLNSGTPVSATTTGVVGLIDFYNAMIGGNRTTYFKGWIARVLLFNRALHYRDNTSLQSLIATEVAGL